ncbi:hypothetical protein HAZT_HAZT001748 [Hyalella azteca]|uniref:Uncharacterized protein n=1 Tax=Hyalella azteca TaxID=294128 RepID=A0A6A0GT20_HYAAZ|nr:hypothetical protein HAZT_HAZT001748 [Hyalella azteca]
MAYLASRRTSRDSETGDVAPLVSARYCKRRPSNFLELPVPDHYRPRVCSLPEQYNPRACDQIYRLRTFSITSKGVINRGSSPNLIHGAPAFIPLQVVLLGESGVGKSALVSQFMTSEYMNTYDASLDDEFGEKSVSVLLDEEENEVVFIDHPAHEMSVENCLTTYEPHACVVVYAVTDRASFKKAEDVLNYLWRESCVDKMAVILVGNKVDLVRNRSVSSEGMIRLRLAAKKKRLKKLSMSRTSLSLQAAKDILHKMCTIDSKSKSCENLHKL